MAIAAKTAELDPATAVPAAKGKSARKSNYIPLRIRFKAWWEGVSIETLMRRQRKAAARKAKVTIDIDKNLAETEATLTDFELLMSIREEVWGKDQVVPGDPEYAVDFLKAAKLKPGVVVLDLAAGLGGFNRSVAVALDALVEGMETDESIAKMGAGRAARVALDKQAPIAHYVAHNPYLKVDRYDCVYAHEAFHKILDKKYLLTEIWKSLKEEGHLIFSDLIYPDPEAENAKDVRAWISSEPETPDPWRKDEYEEALGELGFKIHAFKDDTERYQAVIKEAWANFADTLDEKKIDRRFVDVMMYEAKRWQCRMQAIKDGHLRFVQVHAVRPKASIR